jgi:hypothetical protein
MKSLSLTLGDFLKAISENDPVTFFDDKSAYSGTVINISSNPSEIEFLACVPNATNFVLRIKKDNGLFQLTDGRYISLASYEPSGYTIIIIPQKI